MHGKIKGWNFSTIVVWIATINAAVCVPAYAQYLPVFGGPTYDSVAVQGFNGPLAVGPGASAGSGVGVGSAYKWITPSGGNEGTRPFRWDSTGAVIQMGTLGGSTNYVQAVNDSGTAAGYVWKSVAGSNDNAWAVRWNALGVVTELGNLGTDSNGKTNPQATEVNAINSGGTAVGFSAKYVAGSSKGTRAVRWDASGTAATELDNLGLSSTSSTISEAISINNAGAAVGFSRRYDAGVYVGERAVRWNASGTGVTELGNLGTDSNGNTNLGGGGATANAINSAGTSVGTANKFVAGTGLGRRPVRWDDLGNATELGILGTLANGSVNGLDVVAMNDSGTAVGWAFKYDAAGNNLGARPVRWDGSSTLATELGLLGAAPGGVTGLQSHRVWDINNVGVAVGYATDYHSGSPYNSRAVIWDLDGIATDLIR